MQPQEKMGQPQQQSSWKKYFTKKNLLIGVCAVTGAVAWCARQNASNIIDFEPLVKNVPRVSPQRQLSFPPGLYLIQGFENSNHVMLRAADKQQFALTPFCFDMTGKQQKVVPVDAGGRCPTCADLISSPATTLILAKPIFRLNGEIFRLIDGWKLKKESIQG
jgi:hypothetical protein